MANPHRKVGHGTVVRSGAECGFTGIDDGRTSTASAANCSMRRRHVPRGRAHHADKWQSLCAAAAMRTASIVAAPACAFQSIDEVRLTLPEC